MPHNARGSALVELLLALIVFSVGVLALAGTSALNIRMLTEGRLRSRAAWLASDRLEWLRHVAVHSPDCSALNSGSAFGPGGELQQWAVSGSGALRLVTVSVPYGSASSPHADTLRGLLPCG
jgi:Tfp pilus assembly protein PilV